MQGQRVVEDVEDAQHRHCKNATTSLTGRQPGAATRIGLTGHGRLIDLFTLALTHGLVVIALWRLLFRAELDDEHPQDTARSDAGRD